MGKMLKGILKFTVAVAAVGGICYAFKDKIKESEVYKNHDVDNKINKLKTTIKEKMPKSLDNEEDFVEEDEIFFDDIDTASGEVTRDYVSLDNEAAVETDNDDFEEVANDDSGEADDASDETDNDVPTIDF